MENTTIATSGVVDSEAQRILKGFECIKPSDDTVTNISMVRSGCYQLCELLLVTIPPCRERSLAITKLEELSIWANKALILNQSS